MIKLSSRNLSQYLIDAGICQKNDIEPINIKLKNASNCNFIVSLPNNPKLVVKQIHNHNKSVTNGINNEWQIHMFTQSCLTLSYTSSLALKILNFDESNSILIYKYPKDYIELSHYYKDNQVFPTTIPELLGATLAAIHSETMDSQDCFNFMNGITDGKIRYHFPHPSHLLDRIDVETFSDIPAECLKFFELYQRYENLNTVVSELVNHHHRYCLTHNSFKLDNILIPTHWEELISQTKQHNKSLIRLIDWDRCSWGDPAFDVGSVIASYLLLWLNSLFINPAIDLGKSLQLATITLEYIQPSIVALIRAYISNSNRILEYFPEFFKRVIQFTGLALIYQILAMIQEQKKFDNRSICILQVAKGLLCQPEKSLNYIFGLTESELIKLIPNLV